MKPWQQHATATCRELCRGRPSSWKPQARSTPILYTVFATMQLAACKLQHATAACNLRMQLAACNMQHRCFCAVMRRYTGRAMGSKSALDGVACAQRDVSVLACCMLYGMLQSLMLNLAYTYQGRGDEVCPPRFAESLVDALHRGNSGAIAIRSRMR